MMLMNSGLTISLKTVHFLQAMSGGSVDPSHSGPSGRLDPYLQHLLLGEVACEKILI
jgi:hypothetical protein